jgi:hypothetical protein
MMMMMMMMMMMISGLDPLFFFLAEQIFLGGPNFRERVRGWGRSLVDIASGNFLGTLQWELSSYA